MVTGRRGLLNTTLASFVRRHSLPPEGLEPIGRQLGVAHRVLDIAVPKVGLQRPGVVAVIGQLKA
jgi:hypothetical protein